MRAMSKSGNWIGYGGRNGCDEMIEFADDTMLELEREAYALEEYIRFLKLAHLNMSLFDPLVLGEYFVGLAELLKGMT